MLEPLHRRQWNRHAAAHLLGRAGFGGAPADIAALEALGPEDAVESLLEFVPGEEVQPPDWVEPGVELRARAARRLAGFDAMSPEEKAGYSQARIGRDRARTRRTVVWWIDRMRTTPAPLQEKLALFWHGHFATQDSTVRSGYFMYRQNRLFREFAAAPFEELLLQVCRDPAMLRYLDNDENRQGSPNENFARELLELFTLGEGNYSERDIREVARAFTGWGIDPERVEFRFFPERHDDGPKEILGVEGNLGGEDVVRILSSRPENHRLVARELWTYFVHEDPDEAIVEALAERVREGEDLRPALRAMFGSAAFHSERTRRTRIKGPVEWLVELLRTLEAPAPMPVWTLETLEELGQLPLEPPNVAGWPGGRRWITSANLLARYRRAAELLLHPTFAVVLGEGALADSVRGSRGSAGAALVTRLFPTGLSEAAVAEVTALLLPLPEPANWSEPDVREAIAKLAGTPHYQLG